MQYKEAFMDYKDGLWNRKRLFWNIKKLSCNTKKPLGDTQELLWNTKKIYRIPWSSMEYQEEYQGAVQKYEEVRWNTRRHWQTNRVNACSDSGCLKLLRDDAKSGTNAMKWHQKGSPKASQSAPNGCQIDVKTRQDPQNDAWRQKYQILIDFKPIRDTHSAPFSVQNLIKSLKKACQKSTPEKYQQTTIK